MSSKPDFRFKVILVGDAGVGKSALITRLIDNIFREGYWTSQGEGVLSRRMVVDDCDVELRIWGTDGQERFMALPPIFYHHAHGALVVFDVTDRRTFDNIQFWLDELKNKVGQDIPIVLVGNKKDCADKRVVDNTTALCFSQEVGIPYMETSARDMAEGGVPEVFSFLASRMIDNGNQNYEDGADSTPASGWCGI